MKNVRTTLIIGLALTIGLASVGSPAKAQAPNAETKNEQVVRRMSEAINRHDAKAAAAEHSKDTPTPNELLQTRLRLTVPASGELESEFGGLFS